MLLYNDKVVEPLIKAAIFSCQLCETLAGCGPRGDQQNSGHDGRH
jgi:hypothetical protein